MSEKPLYTRKVTSECTYWKIQGHTGVVLASRCGRFSSVMLSPHFLQTTLAYTPDLGHLAMRSLYGSRMRGMDVK